MCQRIRLLYLNVRPANYKQVSEHLKRAGFDFNIEKVTSVEDLLDQLSRDDKYIVLLDELINDEHLDELNARPPLILLVDGSDEEESVDALERGKITDYVITSQAGFKRLPLVIRAAHARNNLGYSHPSPNTERLRLFGQLKENYDALVVVDQAGKIIYQTKESAYWSGYSREELESINPLDLIHKDDAKNILPLFTELISNPGGEKNARLRILHKDNSWHWYEVSGKNMLDDPQVLGIVIRYSDVTKRRQDEVQQNAVYRITQATLVTESLEDLYSSIHTIISEVMPAENLYIALYDAERGLIDFPYYQDEYDDPPGEPAKLSNGLTAYVIKTRQSLLCDSFQFDQLKENGKVNLIGTAFAAWLGVPLIIGKEVIGVLGVQHYENENAYNERDQRFLEFVSSQIAFAIYRKQTEVDLRESELRFRSLFENSTIGIYRSTPDGRLLLVNPSLLRLSGYEDFDELAAIDLSQSGYVNPEDRIRFQELLEKDGEVRGMESAWRKKDGSAIYVRESARVIRDKATGEIYYEGIVEDISDRKRAEQSLEEKVVALQTLAEIDKEILRAKDSSALLELVCRRATDLLKASSACIASIGKSSAELLAVYGFNDVDGLSDEFSQEPNLKIFNRWKSFSIRNITNKNFSRLMMNTRNTEGIRSVIAEAFEIDPGLNAVLTVFDKKPREWSNDDQQYLKFLVGQIAISLEKVKLLQYAEYRAQNFETLYSLVGDIASRRDLEVVLDIIVDSVIQLFDTQCGFIYLYDEVNETLELSIIHGADLKPGLKIEMGEGLAGRVGKSRKPKHVDSYHDWRYRSRKFDNYRFSAAMEVPMVYRDHLIGVLAVSEVDGSERVFTDDDMRLLSLFAGQAAGAVYNARLFSEIQKRNEELDRLYRALGKLIAGVSSDRYELCQHVCDIVLSEFNHSNCNIWLVKDSSLDLERFGASGDFICDDLNLSVDGKGLIPKVIREGSLINVVDVQTDADYLSGWGEAVSELVVPLIAEDNVIGVIDLQSAKHSAFNQDDERLMTLFSTRAALMIDHVRLLEQTEERNRRLDTLHAIETSFASSFDIRVSLNSVIEQIQARLIVDAAVVYVYDQDIQMLEFVAGRGPSLMMSRQQRIRVGEGLTGRAALEQEIIFIPDLTRPGPVLQIPELEVADRFMSAYIIPLVAKGQLKGVLELFYQKRVRSDPDWMGFLETLARQVAVAIDGIQVFHQLQQSLIEQQVAQDATIESWSRLLEMRGLEPAGHTKRVAEMTLHLAQRMGVDDKKMDNLYKGVLLHDIGKLLLPDSIVHKPGPLSDEEWEIVRKHPVHAYELISKIAPFRSVIPIPYCHHEYWDGSGYPRGLKGEQIPLEARVFQVIETWDLMQVDLAYRKAIEKKDVLEYIQSQSGKRFDPHVVEKFLVYVDSKNILDG